MPNNPELEALDPKSVARDKWIIAGTVGVCLIALVVAMIVALTSDDRTSPSAGGNTNPSPNTNTNHAVTDTPPRLPPKDAGPMAKTVTCDQLRGNWSGVFHAGATRLAHHFTGTVQGTNRACSATFRITTNRQGYVIQYFVVTISGGTITFRGTRVDRSHSSYGYSKDTFVGHLNLARTNFSGRVEDSKGVVGTVRMKKG